MYYRQVPSVWQEMDRLQREMNRMFRSTNGVQLHPAPSFPAMNIWANEDGQVITAEIPGVDLEDLDISVTGEILTLSGNRKAEQIGDSTTFHRRERGYGRFKRSIQLPYPVQGDNIEASFKNGVLTIVLPRAEQDKPRKIVVKNV
ncbi:MAG: Hsp20/alpha crystallin family protein [Anaerolineaceae bacterium]